MSNTVLFVGGEMGAFVPSDTTVTESTLAGSFDPSYARCSISLSGLVGSFARSPVFTSQTNVWVHLEFTTSPVYFGGVLVGNLANLIVLTDNIGNNVFTLSCATSGSFTMKWWNGTTWVSIGNTVIISLIGGIAVIDFNVNLVTGTASLYSSGTLLTTGTASITGTNISQLYIYGQPISNNWSTQYYSQIIIAAQSTIGYKLNTVPIISNGTTDQWSGTYTGVNEIIHNDGSYISANVASLTSNFGQNTTIVGEVVAVAVSARASCGISGPQHLQLELRLNGNEYTSNSIALDTGLQALENIWNINPNTANAWQAADFSTLYYGVKSIT